MIVNKTDIVIIGSGIGSLIAALRLSSKMNVTLICKGMITDSNSYLAQGGIATTIDPLDNWTEHYNDTINAGNNHNIEAVTKELIKSAPEVINQLINLGISFDHDKNNKILLGREGGHHRARIVHAGGDATGKIIMDQLIKSIQQKVIILENMMVHDLIIENNNCLGIIAKNINNETHIIYSPHTILATGGIGNLYSTTSNNQTITGDGLAMAYRANAKLVDLEFVQFHPTMLKTRGNALPLISEAVRGEGAVLRTEKNIRIMDEIHPLKDLAPRDIVSRQLYYTIEKHNSVFLDISMINNFSTRFPTITQKCEENSVDICSKRLPVTPGAHFLMGGVKTDIDGKTNVNGLFAIGEVAGTGCHGSNRLASNSLLEGIFFANKLADYLISNPRKKIEHTNVPVLSKIKISLPTINEIKTMMTEKVGIIRNEKDLIFAKKWFESYIEIINSNKYLDMSNEDKVIQNLLTTGWLITTSALMRQESRGAHYRTDYPLSREEWVKRYIIRRRINSESDQVKESTATISN